MGADIEVVAAAVVVGRDDTVGKDILAPGVDHGRGDTTRGLKHVDFNNFSVVGAANFDFENGLHPAQDHVVMEGTDGANNGPSIGFIRHAK